MQPKRSKGNLSWIYLALAPFLGAILAITYGLVFGVEHISYKIYLPGWMIQSCLMIIAAWIVGARFIGSQDADKKQLVVVSLFMIVPWIFISIFAGFGPPPWTPKEWVATATMQQVRYGILTVSGILITFGFALLRERLKNAGENFYSLLGFTALLMAIPLFLFDMTYYGSYLNESFRIFSTSSLPKTSEWHALGKLDFTICLIEVGLTYLATAAFAVSLKTTGLFNPTACTIYILLSLVGFILNLTPPSFPEPFATAGFVVSVPAVPLIIPYLMGVNLLRLAGN